MRLLRFVGVVSACLVVLAGVVIRVIDRTRTDEPHADGLVGFVRDLTITLVEAGVAAVALFLLVREVRQLVFRHRPRAVEVIGFDRDAAAPGDGKDAWGAVVKATLHRLGALPEPSVPSGAIQPTSLSLADIELPAQANAVAGALKFVADRLRVKRPYRVTAVPLPSDADEDVRVRLLLEVVDVESGQLASQHVIAEETLETSARRAGCIVYQDVTTWGGAPTWERWGEPEGASLAEFLAATEAEVALDYVEALRRYGEAYRAEPANAVVSLRLGNLQERQKLYGQAIRTYASTLLTWPQLVQPRHRLAITLVAVAMDERVEITEGVKRAIPLVRAAGDWKDEGGDDVRDSLLRAAQAQWRSIERSFRLDRALALRLRRATPVDWRTRRGIRRGPMRRNAKVAALGIELYLLLRQAERDDAARRRLPRKVERVEARARGMTAAGPVRRVVRRALRTAPDYRAHYNCACIYSMLLTSGTKRELLALGERRNEFVDRALEQLRLVLHTADREHVFGWALDDQDLAPLWAMVEDPAPPSDVSPSQLAAIDLLRHQFAGGPTIRRVEPGAGRVESCVRIRTINIDATEPAHVTVLFGEVPGEVVDVHPEGYDIEVTVRVPAGLVAGALGVALRVGGRTTETRPFEILGP